MAKFRFDDKSIRDLAPPKSGKRIDYDIVAPSGKGEFVRGFAIRTTAGGSKAFLLVYVTAAGRERRQMIGEYPTHTVTTAREAARKLRALVDAGGDPWADDRQQRVHAESERARTESTLGALLGAYVKQLAAAEKPSAAEVEASIKRNLTDAKPKIAALRADRVTVDDVMPVFHRLTKEGKWRAAEKLAIYFRAAYAAAKAARTDAAGHVYESFGIRTNPMLDLKVSRPKKNASAAADDNQERKWALTEPQLRAYWKRIQALDTPQGALLRFHLITGGQRMEQLSRLTARDLNAKASTVTLWDAKGRREQPRKHLVPLLPDAEAALKAMRPDEKIGVHLFTVSGGAAAAVPHTLAAAMRDVSDEMKKAKEIDRALTPGAIRRTVETVLADNGVSKEIRAQLASHGISGVQDKSYDAGEYLKQKREALETLRKLLDPKAGNVTPFRKKKAG